MQVFRLSMYSCSACRRASISASSAEDSLIWFSGECMKKRVNKGLDWGIPQISRGSDGGLTFTRALATSPAPWQLVAGSWPRPLGEGWGSPVTSWSPCFGMKRGGGTPKGQPLTMQGPLQDEMLRGLRVRVTLLSLPKVGRLKGARRDAQTSCPTPALPAGHGLRALTAFAARAPSQATAPGAFSYREKWGWGEVKGALMSVEHPQLFMFPTHQTSCACGSSLDWCCQKPLHGTGCTQGRWR